MTPEVPPRPHPPQPGVTAASGSQLRIFISSVMSEFRDLRDVLVDHLKNMGLDAWVFEDEGARPENVVHTSLAEVERADVYVGIFWQRYGEVTAEEFRLARRLKKPCFVYIRDQALQRDPALEAFLKTDVYDKSLGVTYDFFDRVQPLARRAADDVLAWLIRRHREMTAVLVDAQVSHTELQRLRDEVTRLRSFSRDPLPQGTAVDSLARDMHAWFGTLGYGIERELERNDQAFEWIINIPARRGFDRILVRGIQGEAELGDWRLLEEAFRRERPSEAWLVTRQRVSQAVRSRVDDQPRRELFCYAFDELLDEKADFSGYLQWLEREVVSRGIDSMYIAAAATKREFDPGNGEYLGESRYDAANGWLEGYINRWLDDPSKEHVSVLGEFGTGKTWFALHYAYIALQRYKAAKESGNVRPRLPLVIPLRDYAKAVSVESLFSEFFFRKYEIPLPNYSAFEQLNRMGKLLLIFDGFDEMASRVDRQQMINNFWELARVVVPGSKAILTCRTEHFPEAKEGRALLNAELKASTANLTGEPPQFEVLELSQFDDEQVRRLLAARTTPAVADLVLRNSEILDLARRPVMTELIVDALPDIAAGKPVDLSRIYFYATTRKMQRDIESGRTFTSLADKLYFLCELAWEMLSNDRMSLNYRLFPDRLANLFGSLVKEQKDLDHWHYDMMRNSMLIRNADGDYQPAHRSLLEFFVALKFVAELGVLAPDLTEAARKQSNVDAALVGRPYTWSQYFRRDVDAGGAVRPIAPLSEFATEPFAQLVGTVGRLPLTKATLDLMQSMIAPGPIAPGILQRLILETRKAGRDSGCIGANAATLWLRQDRNALRELDLSGTHLSQANFTDADLTDCNLQGACLTKSQFVGTVLRGVDLRGADLSEALVSEVTNASAVAASPDGALYAAGLGDGTVRVYETRSGREISAWRAHKSEVNVVRWSPDGQVMVTGGDGGGLALWNGVSGESRSGEIKAHDNWVIDVAFDAERQRIISAGGIESKPLKFWSLSGALIGEPTDVPANQANRLSVSPDGRFLLVSYWNRSGEKSTKKVRRRSETGFALLDLSTPKTPMVTRFDAHSWNLFFSGDGSMFVVNATQNKTHGIGFYDVKTYKLRRFIGCEGTPSCLACDDSVLAVAVVSGSHQADICFDLWSVEARTRLKTLRLGPLARQAFPIRSVPEMCFSEHSRLFIGGSDDGVVRLWDARLWLTPAGEPALDVDDYTPPDLTGLTYDKKTWPEWISQAEIAVPDGFVPNPDFGKLIRVHEEKIVCDGLRLDSTTELAGIVIDGLPLAVKDREVIEWFTTRGAAMVTGPSKPSRPASRSTRPRPRRS